MNNFIIEVLNPDVIPFSEGTRSWQQWVDILTAYDLKTNSISLLDLCTIHDLSPNYYKDLNELIKNDLIKLKEI